MYEISSSLHVQKQLHNFPLHKWKLVLITLLMTDIIKLKGFSYLKRINLNIVSFTTQRSVFSDSANWLHARKFTKKKARSSS